MVYESPFVNGSPGKNGIPTGLTHNLSFSLSEYDIDVAAPILAALPHCPSLRRFAFDPSSLEVMRAVARILPLLKGLRELR